MIFAKVKNNVVIDAIVADQAFVDRLPSEEGVIYVQSEVAGIGGNYDPEPNVFYEEQPFLSWTLDSNYIWQPPIAEPPPLENHEWEWDEAVYQADNTKGWIAYEIDE